MTVFIYAFMHVYSCQFFLLSYRKFIYFYFRFLLRHGGRALLADEMGLGKTLQALVFYLSKILQLQFVDLL